jgi:threonyl-tRNA synthetase
MFVLGKKEVETQSVTIRSRVNKADEGSRPYAEALTLLLDRISSKELPTRED